jgi:uncharacterized protein (TIGR02284 family)
MTISTDDIISVLNELLETCYDERDGFRTSAGELQGQDAIAMCLSRAQRVDDAAAELYTAIRHLGGHPVEHGHSVAKVHRGWIHLRGAAPASTDDSILAEIERGEEAALERYRHALTKPLPPTTHDLLDDHVRDIEESLARVRAMRGKS